MYTHSHTTVLITLVPVALAVAFTAWIATTAGKPGVFVSLPAADAVIKIDPETGTVLARTRVGRLPHHMVVDPVDRRVYVTLTGSQAVAELNADSGALLRTFLTETVPTERADGSRIDAHFSRGAFSHGSCYDCHQGGAQGIKPVIVGTRPFGIALSEDRRSLFVANTRGGGSLVRIDLETGQIVTRKREPAAPHREPTALTRFGDQLLVTAVAPQPSNEPASLRALAAGELSITWDVPCGARPNAIAADPRGERVYAANFETNTVSAYHLDGRHAATYTVGAGPQGLQVLPDHRLLVANYYANSLSLVDLTAKRVDSFPLEFEGRGYSNPSHLAPINQGREALVVTSGSDGYLLRVDVGRQAVTHVMPVGPLPFDVAVIDNN